MTTTNQLKSGTTLANPIIDRSVVIPPAESLTVGTVGADELDRELSRLATAAERERDRRREEMLAQERERAKYD